MRDRARDFSGRLQGCRIPSPKIETRQVATWWSLRIWAVVLRKALAIEIAIAGQDVLADEVLKSPDHIGDPVLVGLRVSHQLPDQDFEQLQTKKDTLRVA